MNIIKSFFGIEKVNYCFEYMDISALLTVFNVVFVLLGYWWAPFFGLVNCIVSIVIAFSHKTHINFYIIQISLIVLNIYFLTL